MHLYFLYKEVCFSMENKRVIPAQIFNVIAFRMTKNTFWCSEKQNANQMDPACNVLYLSSLYFLYTQNIRRIPGRVKDSVINCYK